MKILLVLAYDGTGYGGWQRQPNAVRPTLQAVLEEALGELTGEEIRVQASGRTDTGVHAWCQPVQFETRCPIPPDRYGAALGGLLPRDVAVRASRAVEPGFHVIRDVTAKTYRYHLRAGGPPDPFLSRYCWEHRHPLDTARMRDAAGLLEGTHDFRAFCASGSSARSFVRTIHSIRISEETDPVAIEVTGNGFLYNMVRILVGTLVDHQAGRCSPEEIRRALATGERALLGPTAPPQGLFLWDVSYRDGPVLPGGEHPRLGELFRSAI